MNTIIQKDTDFAEALQQLHHPEASTRWKAANSLGELSASSIDSTLITNAIQSLCATARNNDEVKTVRWNAIKSIGLICSAFNNQYLLKWSIDTLQSTVSTEDVDIKLVSIDALGKIGRQISIINQKEARFDLQNRVYRILVANLINNSWHIREKTVEALSNLGNDSIPLLSNSLNHKSQRIRLGASQVLENFQWQPDNTISNYYYWIIRGKWEKCVQHPKKSLIALEEAFCSWDNADYKGIIHTLTRIGQPAFEILAKLLTTSTDYSIQKMIATSFDELGFQPDTNELSAHYWIAKNRWSSCIDIGSNAIPPLIQNLSNFDEYVRRGAAWSLGRIAISSADINAEDYEAAISSLLQLLADESNQVKIAVVESFERIASLFYDTSIPDKITDGLTGLLYDKDSEIRLTTANVLEKLDIFPKGTKEDIQFWIAKQNWEKCASFGTKAAKPLFTLLTDSIWDIRENAASTLDKIGWHPPKSSESIVYWIARKEWNKCITSDSKAIEQLISTLYIDNTTIQNSVINTIGKIGDRAIAPLVQTIKNRKTPSKTRQLSLNALTEIGSRKAVDEIILCLKDQNLRAYSFEILKKDIGKKHIDLISSNLRVREIRSIIVTILDSHNWQVPDNEIGAFYWIEKGEFGKCVQIGSSATPALIEALNNIDVEVRLSAIHALKTIKDPQTLPPLLSALNDHSTRNAAAQAIGDIGNKDAIDTIKYYLVDKKIQQDIADALDKLSWIPEENIYGLYYWITRKNYAKCIEFGELAINPLIQTLDSSGDKPQLITNALASIGGKAIYRLVELFKYHDSNTRQAAAISLGKIDSPDAIPYLLQVFHNDDEDIRQAAALVLGRISDPNAIPHLIDALNNQSEDIRQVASVILTNVHRNNALIPLCNMIANEPDNPLFLISVINLLADIGNSDTINLLLPYAKHTNKMISEAALGAINQLE